MKNLILLGLLAFVVSLSHGKSDPITANETTVSYNTLASQLMQDVMDSKDVSAIQAQLASADLDLLAKQLDTDLKKKAFWINVYNAHIQLFLKANPELYEDRGAFFSRKAVTIAGRLLSFDDIEHGIIRGSRSKLTLGYTKKIFVSKYERKLRCSKKDGRVHFALNCGAKSCPKVAVFYEERMDEQLTAISKQFLKSLTTIDGNQVSTTTLFSWFRGDFGGKKGAVKFLKKMEIIPQDLDAEISFQKYDWTLFLNNYTEV